MSRIQNAFLSKNKVQLLAIFGVLIFTIWFYGEFAVNCAIIFGGPPFRCEFHMMFTSNETCEKAFAWNIQLVGRNRIFEIFSTAIIPLLFFYLLGFRYILKKLGKSVAFEKSKEIFNVFQYFSIFAYGFIRLFCLFVHCFYGLNIFVPFDFLSHLLICKPVSIFVYAIPSMFLFSHRNKALLNMKTNKVGVVQEPELEAKNEEERIEMDERNTNNDNHEHVAE
ncbi:unnamed protein product [Caenorhabditis angaria]|uniref:Uncharacterized protein n=1 Tax=Caenorhabditis angaria TaxID=860376 RepID=A0A9P1IUJ0_9PELO|nr:unnamed protein product [Caenorhabditis angaria]